MTNREREVYLETMRAFGGCCALCGRNADVQMHHIRYGAAGRKTYMGNVIPLCADHHHIVHNNKRVYQPVLIEIIDTVIGKRR